LFALKGNYDEGFGTRPHKEKWLAKDEVGNGSEASVGDAKTDAAEHVALQA
jgi:hypothetical protein